MTPNVDITMVIRKSGEGLTVSVLPKSNGGLKDEAQNSIVPLTMSGTPQEFDAGFLAMIARPVQKACGLISNMEEFEKQTDKAAANSKASKEQKAKETKEEKEKREKYEKHLKKAEELIAAKNYKDALAALGQARLYATPQNQKTVDEKTAGLKAEMNRGSLFELMEETPQPAVQQPAPPSMQQPVQQPRQPVQGQQPVYRQPAQQMPMQYGQYPQGAQQPRTAMQQRRPAYMQQPATDYGQGAAPHYRQQPAIPPQSMETGDFPPYAEQQQPAFRPEEYEEYPDFPQSMLNTYQPTPNPTF